MSRALSRNRSGQKHGDEFVDIGVVNRTPLVGRNYYYIEFLGNADGTSSYGTFTQWAGRSSENPNVEIRKARFVYADKFIELYRSMDIPIMLVNNVDDAIIFLGYGGVAVMLDSVVQELIPWVLEEDAVVGCGSLGWISVAERHPELAKRSPSRKLRMRVLNRDNRRCRICGRSADSSVDVELHVHHVRPVTDGGVTLEENLITLCAACHGGLDPHFDRSLFDSIPSSDDKYCNERERVTVGQARYRKNLEVDMKRLQTLEKL